MKWVWQRVSKNPAAWLALAAIAGVSVADRAPSVPWLWAVAALLMGGVAVRRPRCRWLGMTCLLVFGFIHQVNLQTGRDHPLRSLLKPGQRVSATLVGRFVRAPMIRDEGPANREARVRISKVEVPYLQQSVTGTADVRVWLADPVFVPDGGEYELSGTLSLVQRPWNPGGFNAEAASLRHGIVADFTPSNTKPVGPRDFSLGLTLLKMAERSRLWITRQLALGLEQKETPRILITTMALGTAESGNAELEEPFRTSGTLHVFAVSGLHVGLMAWIGWFLLKYAGVRRARAVMVLIPLVFGYAFITGWVPSAARAAFMAAVFLLAPLANGAPRLVNSLGIAALILFSADTLQFFQPGFQLSFGVLGAIALGADLLARPLEPLTELDPFMPPMLASRWQRFSVWSMRKMAGLVTTSTTAWVGSVPLMVYYFQSCTPVAVLANVVLVPLSSMSLYMVVLSLIAALLHLTTVQGVLNSLNGWLAELMMVSAVGFSALPGAHFMITPPTLQLRAPVTLQVLSMPIGEGAQMLSSGSEHWWLDCGSARHHRRTLSPFLRQCGITQVDGLILSHADTEHISAAPLLMKRFPIDHIYVGPHEPWRLDSRATAMWQMAAQAGDRLKRWQAGDSLTIGEATVTVLHPQADDLCDKADDRALVLRIDYGRMRILWCGDAGFPTEKSLLDRCTAAELRADVLVRNQHTSDLSALIEFLEVVQPQLVISSNAPTVPEQRLPQHLRQWCQDQQRVLWETQLTGMVQLNTWPDRMELNTWLSGESMTLRAR